MPIRTIKRGKKVIVASVMVNGRRREKVFPGRGRAAYEDAVTWERRTRRELQRKTGGELTVSAWARDYLEFAKVKFKGKNTFGAKDAALTRFLDFVGGARLIRDIDNQLCLQHLRIQARQRSGNAANRDRKELGTAWEYGRKYLGLPAINPFRLVDKFPETKHPRYVPPLDDFLSVFERTSGQDRVMLLTFLCLAPRRSEVFGLKWTDIDFENKRVRLWTRKRKGGNLEYDYLPAIDVLLQELAKWKRLRREIKALDRGYVFVSPVTKRQFQTRSGFLKELCRQAKVKRFGFHAIRHLTALFLYFNGETTQTIQLILRHKDPRTTSKYLKRIGAEEGRRGLGKISERLSELF